MQTLEIEVPAQGKVVHLRLHLPDSETTLEEVNFTQGEKAVSWSFKNYLLWCPPFYAMSTVPFREFIALSVRVV